MKPLTSVRWRPGDGRPVCGPVPGVLPASDRARDISTLPLTAMHGGVQVVLSRQVALMVPLR